MLWVSFSSKLKATNVFPKRILKLKACNSSKEEIVLSRESKELLAQRFV